VIVNVGDWWLIKDSDRRRLVSLREDHGSSINATGDAQS